MTRPYAGAFPVLSQMGTGLYGIQRDNVEPLVCSTYKSGTVSTETAPSSARTTAMPGLAKCNWVGWRASLENRTVWEPCPALSCLALPCPVVAKWLKEKNQGNQAVK